MKKQFLFLTLFISMFMTGCLNQSKYSEININLRVLDKKNSRSVAAEVGENFKTRASFYISRTCNKDVLDEWGITQGDYHYSDLPPLEHNTSGPDVVLFSTVERGVYEKSLWVDRDVEPGKYYFFVGDIDVFDIPGTKRYKLLDNEKYGFCPSYYPTDDDVIHTKDKRNSDIFRWNFPTELMIPFEVETKNVCNINVTLVFNEDDTYYLNININGEEFIQELNDESVLVWDLSTYSE